MTNSNTIPRPDALLPVLFAAAFLMSSTAMANPITAVPDWKPQSSEKLVKLPPSYLKKSIDSDFAESQLGLAIETAEEKSGLKVQSLTDLKSAVDQADGEVKTELRHQLLAEKRAYLTLMSDKNRLRRKQLATKQRLFEGMLNKLGERDPSMTKSKKDLIGKQDAVRARFQSALETVDVRLFESSAVPESKYARKYSENMAVIEKLVGRIKDHRMSAPAQQDGKALTKEQYVRQLLADAQAELSVLDQEETILGYMAKLVALDALSLSEQAIDADLADSDLPANNGPAKAANLFLSN